MKFILKNFLLLIFFASTSSLLSSDGPDPFKPGLLLNKLEMFFPQEIEIQEKLAHYRSTAHFDHDKGSFRKNPEAFFENRIKALNELEKTFSYKNTLPNREVILDVIKQKKSYLEAVKKTVWDPRATKRDWVSQKKLLMSDSYWHEFLDPYHRVGFFTDMLLARWRVSSCPNYFIFLETLENNSSLQRILPFEQRVVYLNKEERKDSLLEIRDGVFYYHGEPFDSSEFFSIHSGKGKAIFVMDADGNLYVAKHKAGHIHHSTLFAGKEVLGAGEVIVENGSLLQITNKSGHYRPGIESMVEVLEKLSTKISLAGVKVEIRTHYFEDNLSATLFAIYDAEDFLQSKGRTFPLDIRGGSKLHDSILKRNGDLLKMALETDIFIDDEGDFIFTPLQLAALINNCEAVDLLLKNKADANLENYGKKALHLALECNHLESVELLLPHTAIEENPFSYLLAASRGGKESLMLVLNQLKLDLNDDCIDPLTGKTLSHILARVKGSSITPDSSKSLVKDNFGVTPIHEASSHGSVETLSFLLQDQNLSDIVDNEGNTPLHYAVFGKNFKTIKFLLEKGGDSLLTKANNKGFYPFTYAVTGLPYPLLKLFLNAGFPVDLEDGQGNTALGHLLKMASPYPMIYENLVFLKENGASDTHYNSQGLLPVHLAILRKNQDLFILYMSLIKDINLLTREGLDLSSFAEQNDRLELSHMIKFMNPKIDYNPN